MITINIHIINIDILLYNKSFLLLLDNIKLKIIFNKKKDKILFIDYKFNIIFSIIKVLYKFILK